MSFYQRKDGRYVVKFKDSAGYWRQRTFKSQQEALKFDEEAEYDAVENERPTLLECVLAFLKNTTHSKLTTWQYRFAVMGYDRKDGKHTEGPAEMLATRYADTLKWRDLNTVYDNCRARGMSNASINLVAGKLQAALSWCASRDMIDVNPWAKYKPLKATHKSRQGSLEDLQKAYACAPAWIQWAVKTAMSLCLRPGMAELFRLRWKAFHWPQRAVSVAMSKTGTLKTVYPPEGYLAEAWERYCADGKDSDMLVCRDARDKPVGKSCYDKAWRTACRKAGVSLPMYAARHIAASQMLAAGADLAAVAAQLGHANATTTGRYYAHALPEAQRDAGRKLALVQLDTPHQAPNEKA